MKFFTNLITLSLETNLNGVYLKIDSSDESVSNYPNLFSLGIKFFEVSGTGSGEVIQDCEGLHSHRILIQIDKEFTNTQFLPESLIFYSSEMKFKDHLPVELLDSNLVDMILEVPEVSENTYSQSIDSLRHNLSLSLQRLKASDISLDLYNQLGIPQEITSLDYAKLLFSEFDIDQFMRQFSSSQAQFKNYRGSETVLRMLEYFFNLRLKINFLYTKDYKDFKANPDDLNPDTPGDPFLTTHYQISFISENQLVDGDIQKFIEVLFKMYMSLRLVRYTSVLTSWSSVLNVFYCLGVRTKTQYIQNQVRYLLDGGSLKPTKKQYNLDCEELETQTQNKLELNGRCILYQYGLQY